MTTIAEQRLFTSANFIPNFGLINGNYCTEFRGLITDTKLNTLVDMRGYLIPSFPSSDCKISRTTLYVLHASCDFNWARMAIDAYPKSLSATSA